jgi:hypothetical protein
MWTLSGLTTHMRIQMTEIATKLGSTGLRVVGNYHLQAKLIASEARDSIQLSLERSLCCHNPHSGYQLTESAFSSAQSH